MHRTIEAFLAHRPFERAPWAVVAFGAGIAGWAVLPAPADWLALLTLCGAVAAGALVIRPDAGLDHLRQALLVLALMVAAGCATIWTKSALVGAVPLDRPVIGLVVGRVLDRQDETALGRTRLILAARVAGVDRPVKVRINVPLAYDDRRAGAGAVIRLPARLMPPAPPMLPGGYDFAMAAWFQGLAATGSALGPVTVDVAAPLSPTLRHVQQALADHVRQRLAGSPGAIAAALASGDRGAITPEDEAAMRDAGLTHLLSISGLHVSAVIAGVYALVAALLALVPWIALRVRVPLVAALAGALAGTAYTLVTGAEVPTIRSVLGSLLILAALALGREPLSLRLLAVAALGVMLFWPEAVLGPSFQMSFASVIAIVAFHGSAPVRAFVARREESWPVRIARHLALLLATGVVVELALLPVALFHFHRGGFYGALANVVAIPLTTFATMPLIALALLLDLAGWGAPAWWLAGLSLRALLALAHWTAGLPGAVALLPAMPRAVFALFVAGLLWLALWSGRVRLWGFGPIVAGVAAMALVRAPDLLVSGDGHQVAIADAGGTLLTLRDSRSDYARQNLQEAAALRGPIVALEHWPGARCNADFCALAVHRGGRTTTILMARGRDPADTLDLAAACERTDIVVADRRLPQACRPRRLKIDRTLLDRTGGLAIDLRSGTVATVAALQGRHGWSRFGARIPRGPAGSAGPPPSGARPTASAGPQ